MTNHSLIGCPIRGDVTFDKIGPEVPSSTANFHRGEKKEKKEGKREKATTADRCLHADLIVANMLSLLGLITAAAAVPLKQQPLAPVNENTHLATPDTSGAKGLNGRFLHITGELRLSRRIL